MSFAQVDDIEFEVLFDLINVHNKISEKVGQDVFIDDIL